MSAYPWNVHVFVLWNLAVWDVTMIWRAAVYVKSDGGLLMVSNPLTRYNMGLHGDMRGMRHRRLIELEFVGAGVYPEASIVTIYTS